MAGTLLPFGQAHLVLLAVAAAHMMVSSVQAFIPIHLPPCYGGHGGYGCSPPPLPPSPPAPKPSYNADAVWTLRPSHNPRQDSCLDFYGQDTSNGIFVNEWQCYGDSYQQFRLVNGLVEEDPSEIYLIKDQYGRCLDVPASDTTSGTQFIMYECHGGLNQQFYLTPTSTGALIIISRLAGKCVDIQASGLEDGTPVLLWDCTGNPNQAFYVVPA